PPLPLPPPTPPHPLPSFPTRRSSDLDPMASPLLQPFAQFPPAIPATERERLTRAARDAYTQRVAPAYRKLYDYFVGSNRPGPRADRKSTRLNSSHLVISYAVFCLKKK